MNRNPEDQFECPDDRHCITCGEELPADADGHDPAWYGFCNGTCMDKEITRLLRLLMEQGRGHTRAITSICSL